MSDESKSSIDNNDSYEQLRQWYLARQRQLAQEEANKTMATPASQIAYDKKAIRSLVESAILPAVQTETKPNRFGLIHLLFGWFLVQIASVCILSFHEHSLQQGFLRFFDLTFMSLVPRANLTPIDDVTDKLCFMGFFILPGIAAALMPHWLISAANSKQRIFYARILSHNGALLCLGLVLAIAVVLFLFNWSATMGPEALSLTKDSVEGPERCFFSWACLLLLQPIAFLKSNVKSEESAKQKLLQIQAEVNGTAGTKTTLEEIDKGLADLHRSIQELMQRERAIADFSKNVIICFDKSMNIEAISMSCLSQWGYHQHELLSSSLERIIFQEDYQHFVSNVHASHGSIEQHARIRKGDNSIMDCHWFIDWSAQLRKYFASCEDITDRMNLERARNDFIAQLTHDMRSPLSGVSMSLDLISDKVYGELPQKLLNSVEVSKQSLSRVLQLITDILDAERLRHGKHGLTAQKVDLLLLTRLALDELNFSAIEKKVKLSVLCNSESLFVRADPKLLSRVLTNLLSNALSFSPENSELKVEIGVSSDSALWKVIDKGPGIHQDYHRIIFERFGAPKMISNIDRPSTGIGLSICRDVISGHGGLIGVESEPGKGSTFWFTLPLERKS